MIDVLEIKQALLNGDLKISMVRDNIILTDAQTQEAIKLCALRIQGLDGSYDY